MKKVFFSLALAGVMLTGCQNTASQNSGEEETKDQNAQAEEKAEGDSKGQLPDVPANASVDFGHIADGDTLTNPVAFAYEVSGMEVEPAGEVNPGKGHHHLLINHSYTPKGEALPADSTHIHYGGGQTADTLNLPAGKHALTMQFADGYHRSYGKSMSKTVKVYVKGE
ncbi:MAG: DUF4399 domain-containing protein [Schleiferiaceae bacterium]|jgi:uncharacterized protein YceK|nr:DUF4399 domain-containing protein [Schleiferiaceae bacterium]MDR9443103.1 DUF4399 domain-containing protein [Schleiferiaceae bacterium]